jgi:hypothetical protein
MRRLTPVQYMKMAALMYGRAQATSDPERRQRRIMLANAHLDLALKATVQEEQAGYSFYRPAEDVKHPGDNGVVLGRTASGVRLAWQAVAREASERIAAKTKSAELQPPDADYALYQSLLPFFKAGMADFANDVIDIRELIRGLIRFFSKAGMSPDAIRDMKRYVVRFVEDVRCSRENLVGAQLPIPIGDVAEPEM